MEQKCLYKPGSDRTKPEAPLPAAFGLPRNTARLTLLLSLVLGSLKSNGEEGFYFTPRLVTAYSDIQKLRLEYARTIIQQEKTRQAVNGFVPYLESYADFFYLLITDNKKEYTQFGKRQDTRLQQLARCPESSPYQRMMMAEIRLHSAFIKLKFGNRTSGCWEIVKANKLLEDNVKLFPGFIPHLKALGLLHVMIGSVPDEYQWVARMMGLKGGVKQGLAELDKVEKESGLFAKEARVTALLLNAYVLHPDKDVIARLKQLPYQEPDNLLFHFLSASILMKKGESETALAILNKAPRGSSYLPFPFLHYMKGEVNIQKGLYDRAVTEYDAFLQKTAGSNFVKDSNLKLLLCRWLEGNLPNNTTLSAVMDQGSLNVEADKHAQKTAERFRSGKITAEQRVLFQARFALDGGFLTRATSALEGLTENSFEQLASQIEFNYRLGRILQYQDKPEECIPYLKRTVRLNQGYDYYFGASAALQLGYLYKENGHEELAAEYFRKALSFKKHEYKNSIDNKARAALTEMNKK